MAKYPNSRGRFQNRNRGPKGLRRNDRIRASEVRVIGPEGTNLGVMSPKKALDLARNVGLILLRYHQQHVLQFAEFWILVNSFTKKARSKRIRNSIRLK